MGSTSKRKNLQPPLIKSYSKDNIKPPFMESIPKRDFTATLLGKDSQKRNLNPEVKCFSQLNSKHKNECKSLPQNKHILRNDKPKWKSPRMRARLIKTKIRVQGIDTLIDIQSLKEHTRLC